MKYVIGLIVLALLVAGGTYIYRYQSVDHISEAQAIEFLNQEYPQYAKYPNDNLPPQSIRTLENDKGWYVAFVQEGSGRPIIEAYCYFLTNTKEVQEIGHYQPTTAEMRDFSVKTCQPI